MIGRLSPQTQANHSTNNTPHKSVVWNRLQIVVTYNHGRISPSFPVQTEADNYPARIGAVMQQDSVNPSPSRHNRWYERVLLNPFLGHMIAILSLTAGAQFLSYQRWVEDENQAYTLLWLLLTYLLSVILS